MNIKELFDQLRLVIDRIWSMPNRRTFSIKPIRELILEELVDGVIIDPFAHNSKIANITNDLDPECETDYHMDALDFLKLFDDESVDMVLFDPPYSPRQVSEVYKKFDRTVNMETTSAKYWSNLKDEIARIIKPGGKVITCAWNSGGIGKSRGFDITRVRLVPHGGWHHDTIVTVEVKTGGEIA